MRLQGSSPWPSMPFTCTAVHIAKMWLLWTQSEQYQKRHACFCQVPQDQPRELAKLSDIRWACRCYACRNLTDRLPAALQVLHDIDEENNGDRSVEARGLRGQLNLDETFRGILGDVKFLSDTLQSSSEDLARAVDLIEALQDSVVKYRDESCFDQLWTEVLSMGQQCNIKQALL